MNILKLFYKTKREMPLGWEPREARGLLAQVWSTGRLGSCCWDSYAHYTLLSIQLPEFSFQSVSSMMLHLCAKPLNGFLEIRVEIWQLVHKAIHDLGGYPFLPFLPSFLPCIASPSRGKLDKTVAFYLWLTAIFQASRTGPDTQQYLINSNICWINWIALTI